MNILLTWLGDADYTGFFNANRHDPHLYSLLDFMGERFVQKYTTSHKEKSPKGPVKVLLEKMEFNQVHFLTMIDQRCACAFAKWAGYGDASIHYYDKNKSPISYADVYPFFAQVMDEVYENKSKEDQVAVFLTPGTPTMTASWVILGKSIYSCTFYQTHANKVIPTEIPFRVVVDVDRVAATVDQSARNNDFSAILGVSPVLEIAKDKARKASTQAMPVILLGESGTGKELFARAIHHACREKDGKEKPFVPINCAAIPSELLEAELFGYKKGAFTGALIDKAGAFKRADKGTLFLDEIGELPPAFQPKLLRVIQADFPRSGSIFSFTPLGGITEERADVKLVFATNADLAEMVRRGKFRADLYYRIMMLDVSLPPLRKRQGDAALLAQHFLTEINAEISRQYNNYIPKQLTTAAIQFINSFSWPGNVRELHTVIMRLACYRDSPSLTAKEIEDELGRLSLGTIETTAKTIGGGFNFAAHLDEIKRSYLAAALNQTNGKIREASNLLGFNNYQTFQKWCKDLNVEIKKPIRTEEVNT